MSFSPQNPSGSHSNEPYKVGTLTYTARGLFSVLFWMLLGDFCLQIMEQLPTSLVPLQLRWADASAALIGFLTGSLPALLGIALNPFIGVQSDRHRGPLGRRRPFLLWSTPLVVVALLGLGFAQPIADLLAGVLQTGASASSIKIGWIGACMVVFVVANTYIMQVYQFLFVDVIPHNVMGKFVGCYRAVGAMGAFVFHRFLFGHAKTDTAAIYSLAALLYAISFLLLVWKVKEGDYPPPPTRPSEGKLDVFKSYFRDCFGHRIYWETYSLSLFFWSALVPFGTFLVFFGTQPGGDAVGYAPTVGLSLAEFGKIKGWCALVGVPVFFLVGPLVDRFHPLRIAMVGLFLSAASFLACFFFIKDAHSLNLWLIINAASQAVYMGSYLAILPRLLPRAKYGQFFTANQIFGFSGVVLAPVLCGWLIEHLRDYRLVFFWCAACASMSLVMCVLLYRHWQKLGGEAHYTPPDQTA
jgi:hypothetical protein